MAGIGSDSIVSVFFCACAIDGVSVDISYAYWRTGCFLAGLEDGTYGIASNLPWAINFGDGIRRHPTNLYEIMFWLILWVSLILIERKHEFTNGARFKVFMASYLIFRLLVEFIKPAYFLASGSR
jgi:phosphatidylglycerol:prolipoprotein diacylglycerol transferase